MTKAAMGALVFALPSKPKGIFGEPRAIKRMPVLFVGHGNPINAIERTPLAIFKLGLNTIDWVSPPASRFPRTNTICRPFLP